ncbi:MAG TPA: NADH-quinone oxidoreductase subunit N [Candidatus Latescibacteria bacterium]|mgnify:FL=1|nr:NADH-quinone oxidoreductase subunit N [Candidatus Latescibacterota bacterium]HOS64435.1 NADH-quinone oxidoreductase subunit N [Candidatus Latescibacterota bacterium]HPK75336.1 NADH-quinone oxidoreductase subunit N [Candidatus Latescibacterota bacterium]
MISASDIAVLLPEIVLVAGAIILLMLDAFSPRITRRFGALLASVVLFAALLAVQQGEPSKFPAFGALVSDAFTDMVAVSVLLFGFVAVISAWSYLEERGLASGEFMAAMLATSAGMILISRSSHLMVIFVALEILSIGLYMLIGYDRTDVLSAEAGLKYFILGAFASALFLFGAVLLYGVTGTMQLTLEQLPFHTRAGQVGIALCIAGLGFKISAAPFHLWTPDVYQGAPTPVTAFLSSASKIAAFAALLRVVLPSFSPFAEGWHAVWIALAALTMFVGNVAALVQENVKRILAYSSIAHVGFMLMALAGGATVGPVGIEGLLFYLLTYAVSAAGAFAAVAVIPGSPDIDTIRGLAKSHPSIAALFALFLLSLAGVPPLVGFLGKLYAFRSAVDAGMYKLAAFAALNTAMGMYYYLRIIVRMYMEQRAEPAAFVVPQVAYPVLVLAALAVVLLGLFPDPVLVLVRQSAEAVVPLARAPVAF